MSRPSRETLALMRFGLGPRPGRTVDPRPEALVAELGAVAAAAPLFDERTEARLNEAVVRMRRALRAQDGGAEAERAYDRTVRRLFAITAIHEIRDLRRAVETPHGFGERMARFWENHFSISVRAPAHRAFIPRFSEEAIRPNLAGRFADLAEAAITHPAMLMHLDQNRSFGPDSPAGRKRGRGMNENLAREVLELHTLGVDGPYDQDDVQALAALLTGFTIRDGEFRYLRRMAQPGRVTLLGAARAGADEAETRAALRTLARHPATARHLARKLAAHFVADAPPEALVAAIEARWRDTDGDLPAVAEAMLAHPAAWGPLGGKVRRPRELIVAALRAAEARAEEIGGARRFDRDATLGGLKLMGQEPGRAPGPDGWPEAAEHWITPGGMAARLQWAGRMGRRLADRVDPRVYAEAALRDALSPETARAVAFAAERWEGHALLLASPDFNRR